MTDADAGGAATLAVVVSPGVSPYLPRTLRGLAEQTRPVGTVLVVDTSAPGREVGTGVPVHAAIDAAGLRAVSTVRVLHIPAPRTFGAAVRAALADHEQHLAEHARRHERPEPSRAPWLWLLHDDSAPEPRAHAELLRTGESGPSIAVAGPKQRDWARPDLLLEVGVRATSTGRRVPDVEDGEIDQGQHDSREDVLAVGTAGALVRRTVWDELGGPDPSLGPFGDGLDLSQRAWLAGHRVVLVPGAVVHHARASFSGLRDLSTPGPDRETAPDPRRSFAARRRSQLFLWLTTTPWYWVPLVVLAILVLAPVRALWRVTTKEIGLVGAEMRAAAEVLARPAAIWRARRRHRRTRTVPVRYLKPLRSSWRDVARAKRDERRSQAAVRAHRVAPSELELRERAALARRRRGTLGVLLLGLVVIGLVAFGPLLTAGALRGGALATIDAGARELWEAATSAWVTAGLGHAGPPDPLLAVLAVATAPLAGGSGNILATAVLVLAVPLAGLGAWFAAGAASRSVLLRAWAAAVWAVAPTLLLGVGQGRLGAVLAHVVLPWVALGIARAVGVQRRDVILPGIADARRSTGDDALPAHTGRDRDVEPVPDAADAPDVGGAEDAAEVSEPTGRGSVGTDVAEDAGPGHGARLGSAGGDSADAAGDAPAERRAGAGTAGGDSVDADGRVDAVGHDPVGPSGAADADAVRNARAGAAGSGAASAGVAGTDPGRGSGPAGDDRTDTDGAGRTTAEPDANVRGTVHAARATTAGLRATAIGPAADAGPATRGAAATRPEVRPTVGTPAVTSVRQPSGSIAAAAGAGLALAVVCAGAPVLLPAAVVVLLGLALAVPRRRRLLLLVAAPAVLLLGPLLAAALGDLSAGSWRVLVADPGVPLGVSPGASWLAALGWPMALPELVGPWPTVLALAGGAAVVAAAVLALTRGTGRARAVRTGWLAVVVGLGTSLLSSRTPVSVGTDLAGDAQVVNGWAGAGVSLALLGMLVAATAAGDGMRGWLTARSFGWRHLTVGAVIAVMVLGPLLTTGAWLVTVVDSRGEDPALLALDGRDAPPVPALARELQSGSERSRVLALHADGGAVRPEIWRHAGPQLPEAAAVVGARGLGADGTPAAPDAAAAELAALVAQLATGTVTDAGEQLGRLAVGVVLVPPLTDGEAAATRQDLIARLDATAGLERVTENASGVIWRTAQSADRPGAAQAVSRARLVDADGTVLDALPARPVTVSTRLPAGAEGRRVVLAERADSAWRATYNGRPLRATTDGWRQAFEIPAHTGHLEIGYEPAWQLPWRVAQVVGLGLTVLLAVPVRRRREETV